MFGHQHRKPSPPPWPLQSVPRSSMILMAIVCLQNRTTNSPQALAGISPSWVSAPASGTSGSKRVAWKMRLDMLAGSGCCVKAKHKDYNLYTARSRCAGELLLFRAVWRIRPLIIVNGESKATRTGLHGPPPYLEKRKCVSSSRMRSAASCVHQDTRHLH